MLSDSEPLVRRGNTDRRRLPNWKTVLLSGIVTLLAGSVTLSLFVLFGSGNLMRNDGTAYFVYARSLVVDRDSDITNEFEALDGRFEAGAEVMQAIRASVATDPHTGRTVLPWPIGMGLVMAPFYGLGFALEILLASSMGRSPDSYGIVPQMAVGIGSLGFGLLAFWSIWLTSCRVGRTRSATIGTLAALLGGPAVFYIFFHATMSHAASLGLVSLLVALWWRGWESDRFSAWGLGLLLGLIVIVRYQNVVFSILPVALLARQALSGSPRQAIRQAVRMGLAAALPLSLQAAHLVASSGSVAVLVQTSAAGFEVGRNEMDLLSPHFVDVLFSCQHGLFYWTPALAIAVLGLVASALRSGPSRLLLLVFVADVYLVGCLQGMGGTNWSGAYAFGMRYLIECAPLFAVGLTWFVEHAGSRPRRLGAALLLTLLVGLNGMLIFTYGHGTISRVGCVTYGAMVRGFAAAVE